MKRNDPIEVFARRAVRNEGCWEWAGAHTSGYGVICYGGTTKLAHRWAYEYFVGPIPDGLQIDHLCRNRGCVNPLHLEAVTQRENVQRGIVGQVNAARQKAKTHCPHGHEYSPDNTYVYPTRAGGTCRQCKICKRAQYRRRLSSRVIA